MNTLIARDWRAYALLDSGDGDKLECIGDYLVQRPCPQAIWSKQLPDKRWQEAQSICHRSKDGGGHWTHPGKTSPVYQIDWPVGEEAMCFEVRYTSFGHCGIFFEQIPVWSQLYARCLKLQQQLGRAPKMVNLFGYTGCASVVMAAAGAEVFHVDSAKGVLNWGKANEKLNPWVTGSIRWIHDDVRSFLTLSQKKGFTYDGILVDPPSWGHGNKKQVWDFNQDIAGLMDQVIDVIDSERGFCLLTSHTHGVQHDALKNMFYGSQLPHVEAGELGIRHADDERILPAGIYAFAEV